MNLGIEVFTALPFIAAAGLLAVVAITAWFLLRNIIPPAPGGVLGHYEVIGRIPGTSFKITLRGLIVDCTPLLLNANTENALRNTSLRLAQRSLEEKPMDEEYREKLRKFVEAIQTTPLSKLIRVYAMRSGIKKYLLIQWGRVEKSLVEYAAKDLESRFTLSFGPQMQGTVTGIMYHPPRPVDSAIGKVTPCLFLPDDYENPHSPIKEVPKEILHALPLLPVIAEYDELIRVKEEEARRHKAQADELARQNAQLQAKIHSLETALFGGEKERKVLARKADPADLITILMTSILGYVAADRFFGAGIVGVIVGGIIGLLIASRRR